MRVSPAPPHLGELEAGARPEPEHSALRHYPPWPLAGGAGGKRLPRAPAKGWSGSCPLRRQHAVCCLVCLFLWAQHVHNSADHALGRERHKSRYAARRKAAEHLTFWALGSEGRHRMPARLILLHAARLALCTLPALTFSSTWLRNLRTRPSCSIRRRPSPTCAWAPPLTAFPLAEVPLRAALSLTRA